MTLKTKSRIVTCDFGCGCDIGLVCEKKSTSRRAASSNKGASRERRRRTGSGVRSGSNRSDAKKGRGPRKPLSQSRTTRKLALARPRASNALVLAHKQRRLPPAAASARKRPGRGQGKRNLSSASGISRGPGKVLSKHKLSHANSPKAFVRSSLSLTKLSEPVDEGALARKAYIASRQLFSSDSSTRPVRQKPFTNIYHDTIVEEQKRRKKVAKETRKHSVA